MDQVLTKKIFEFSSFTVDPNTHLLMKQGQVVEIEPILFETLLLLLENNQRVVTKDELIQSVWGGRLVSDNVITRTIYKIRKLIDVDDNCQSMIRTVRGKGYQFITEVNKRGALNAKSHTSIGSHAKQVSTKWFLIASWAVLLICILAYYSFDLQITADKKPSIQNTSGTSQSLYPVIVVLPINTSEGSDKLTILTQSVLDFLSTQLAVKLPMKVVHPDSVSTMKDQSDDIWAIQQSTHARFIIEGFLETVAADTIKIHFRLYKINKKGELTPYSLGGFEFPYPDNIDDLNELYRQRRVTIREIISLIKPGVIIRDDFESETQDTEAYRMAIAAHHIMRSDSCEKIYQAEDLLKQATVKDPRFVYAWTLLFANYFKRIWVCGESTDNYQKALDTAEIVEKLAPNKSKLIAVALNAILVETNKVEAAYELAKDADWNVPNALYRKVYALRYAGFLTLAKQNIDRLLQIDPFYFNQKPIHQAPNTLLYLNLFDEHLSLLAKPGNAYHDYFRGLNLLFSGNQKQAKVILKSVVDKTPNDLFGRFAQALLFMLNNNNVAALEIINQISAHRIEKHHTDGELTYKQAQLFAMAGDFGKALDNLELAVNQGFFPVNYFKTDPALKSIRSMPRFDEIIDRATERHIQFAARFGLEPEVNK